MTLGLKGMKPQGKICGKGQCKGSLEKAESKLMVLGSVDSHAGAKE